VLVAKLEKITGCSIAELAVHGGVAEHPLIPRFVRTT